MPDWKRLRHALPPRDLAFALARTYGKAKRVDDERATELLERALAAPALADEVYAAIRAAIEAKRGPRTDLDTLFDRFAGAAPERIGRIHALDATPEVTAFIVRIDLDVGDAPEAMRTALDTPKGRELAGRGLATIATSLVADILR
jgi:hypothetical protein